jgi:hypothetical protein
LKSGFTVDQTFNEEVAKNKGEKDRLVYYASVIQKLQKEMGFTSGLATFPGVDTNPEV